MDEQSLHRKLDVFLHRIWLNGEPFHWRVPAVH